MTAAIQGLKNDAHDLRAEMQRVRRGLRVLIWMTGATLACVVAIWGIIIAIGLHVILHAYWYCVPIYRW